MSEWAAYLASLVETIRYLPFVVLALLLAPLAGLAAWGRIYPHAAQWRWALLPLLLSLALVAANNDILLALVAACDMALLLVAMLDLFSLPKESVFFPERTVQRIASLGQSHAVTLVVSNQGAKAYRVCVRDDLPEKFEAEPGEFEMVLAPRSRATLNYMLTPRVRGAAALEYVYLRVSSRLGLWQRFMRYAHRSAVNVYPDMKQLAEYAVLARTNRLSQIGLRRTRKIGQDNEFERMRDYLPDDNYKHIDWRATARRNRLTVREFQANQSQRLIFLVDCGRMMTNLSHGASLLDHALNSMLMLSYVALERGDSVGLICFEDGVRNFVPPQGGRTQMNRLLHASYDRFPRMVESRYDEAFLYLAAHCRKRSLVILITNLIDEVNANQLSGYLRNLAGRHLPLGVLLRDHQIFEAADQRQPEGNDLFRAAAAADILNWRHQLLADLEHQGVLTLDVFPEQMTAPLVNRYLSIKSRHLL